MAKRFLLILFLIICMTNYAFATTQNNVTGSIQSGLNGGQSGVGGSGGGVSNKANGNYSAEVKAIIQAYNGKPQSVFRDVTSAMHDKLNNEGLYMVTSGNDKKLSILTKDELYQYCKNNWDGQDALVGAGASNAGAQVISEICKKIRAEAKQAQTDAYKAMVVANPNGTSPYMNSLGKGTYCVKEGYIVQDQAGIDYMNSLSGKEKDAYKAVEREVFLKNNPGTSMVAVYGNDVHNFSKGTYTSLGIPYWIERTPGATTVDMYGTTRYVVLNKTLPEYYSQCGGTEYAYRGWSDHPQTIAIDGIYDDIVNKGFPKEQFELKLIDSVQ